MEIYLAISRNNFEQYVNDYVKELISPNVSYYLYFYDNNDFEPSAILKEITERQP